jgi:hypothetical protein
LDDLGTIERAVFAQTRDIVKRAADRFEAKAKASTPVGKHQYVYLKKGKSAPQRLSTGWQRRQIDPWKIYIANIRPHAHLAAKGWDHVHGKSIPPFVPWIKDAMVERERMVQELTDVLGANSPIVLRALEIVP